MDADFMLAMVNTPRERRRLHRLRMRRARRWRNRQRMHRRRSLRAQHMKHLRPIYVALFAFEIASVMTISWVLGSAIG